MPAVRLGDQSVAYSVRRSKRAKRVSLRMSPERGLEVVYPPGIRKPAPEAFILDQSQWVLQAMEKLRQARQHLPRRTYEAGERFLYMGEAYRLKLERDPQLKKASARIHGDELLVTAPVMNPTLARGAVEAFYRAEAKRYLGRRLCELAALHAFEYKSLRVRNQKTRWGSCSAAGNINLNLRLMMAPPAVIDYVILHELCHTRDMSHSPAFWRLVESRCPEFRRWRAWLKQHGGSLIL